MLVTALLHKVAFCFGWLREWLSDTLRVVVIVLVCAFSIACLNRLTYGAWSVPSAGEIALAMVFGLYTAKFHDDADAEGEE